MVGGLALLGEISLSSTRDLTYGGCYKINEDRGGLLNRVTIGSLKEGPNPALLEAQKGLHT